MLNETIARRPRPTPEWIVRPGDAAYEEARLAWNRAADQRPAAVALPETGAQVAEAIRYARDNGLRVAPQSTGHAAAALEGLEDALLLKTSQMRSVSIDPVARTARACGGTWWSDVSSAAGEHGLAALAGSSPDVGVAGYTLGGGMSWMARRYGFAANHVRAIDVATADGELVRADPTSEPELFWALRGGGGSFGVVTAIEMELMPVSEVFAGMILFPIERASEVLNAWRAWTDGVSEDVTSCGRLLWLPPIPEIPEPMRGRAFAGIEAVLLMEPEAAAEQVAELRALGPVMDTFGVMPAQELCHLHMDPEHPVPGLGDGMLLDDFSPLSIAALLGAVGTEQRSPLVSYEVRHCGGALARHEPTHGAIGAIDAGFAAFGVGIAPVPEAAAAVEATIERVAAAMAPWRSSRTYTNFAESRTSGDRLFGAYTHARLRAVKAAYDPDNVFRANHPVVA
jgi:FAD/FMN-containing dehydrogenase